jgi:hypothetical protein
MERFARFLTHVAKESAGMTGPMPTIVATILSLLLWPNLVFNAVRRYGAKGPQTAG